MTIGWALLGPGRHAERNVAPQMSRAAGIRPVAVLSRDRARGEAFAEKYGFAKVHTTLAGLLADPGIDAVYDATPDGLHAANALACAEAGKPALIDKPLSASAREAAEVAAAFRRRGLPLGVVYNQRHDPAHQEARRMVLAGEIGEVALARVQINLNPPRSSPAPALPVGGNWRTDPKMRPGGILFGIADHAFDTLAYMLGQEIVEVTALSDASGDNPPNEKLATLLLRLSGGAIGYAASTGRTPFSRRPFEIHGSAGSLAIANSFAYLTGSDGDGKPSLELVAESGRTLRQFEPAECFRLEIEQFTRAVAGQGAPMTPGEQGVRNLRIVEAAYRSVREKRTVRVEAAE